MSSFVPLNLAYWVYDLNPFVFRFPENPYVEGIRWYGVAYVTGFIIAAVLLHFYYKKGKSSIDPDQQTTLFTALIIGVLVGGRLGHMILYDWNTLIKNPLTLLQITRGGMASHGAFVGVVLSIIWFAHHTKNSSLYVLDIVATLAPPGIFLGRIANFINGELWGKISHVPWAIIFPDSADPRTPLAWIQPRHPSQLYEAFLEGIVLCAYTQIRFWTKKSDTPNGQIIGEFFIAYSIVRIIGEMFRAPDASLIMELNAGQFYSIFIGLAGICIIIYLKCSKVSKTF